MNVFCALLKAFALSLFVSSSSWAEELIFYCNKEIENHLIYLIKKGEIEKQKKEAASKDLFIQEQDIEKFLLKPTYQRERTVKFTGLERGDYLLWVKDGDVFSHYGTSYEEVKEVTCQQSQTSLELILPTEKTELSLKYEGKGERLLLEVTRSSDPYFKQFYFLTLKKKEEYGADLYLNDGPYLLTFFQWDSKKGKSAFLGSLSCQIKEQKVQNRQLKLTPFNRKNQ